MIAKSKLLTLTLLNKYRQFVLYSVIGASGATLDFITFLFLYNALHVNPLLATIASVSIGIINNFVWNALYNFKIKDNWMKRFASFYAVGILGIILSVIIIYLLHNEAGMSANLAKLISIPVIVITQYALNKHVTFGSKGKEVISFMARNRALLVVNVLLLFSISFFIKYIPIPHMSSSKNAFDIPASQAPDEYAHFVYNTKFIIDYKRLPVSGKDDIQAYRSCHDNKLGKVTCQYSYNVFPAVPYIISAVTAELSHDILHMTEQVGARLPGLFYGLIFLNFAYLAFLQFTKSKQISLLLATTASFIPQVLFSFSYLNLDGFSLAISAVLTYTFINYIQTRNMRSMILFSIAVGGLLPLAKYNFFVLVIPLGLVLINYVVRKLISTQELLRLIGTSVIAFVALASFWYIRNWILYKDLLGQSFVLHEMSKYHAEGTPIPFNLGSLTMLVRMEYFWTLFKSFFVAFGSMIYYLADSYYTMLSAGVFGLASFLLYRVSSLHDKIAKQLLFLSSVTFVLSLGLVLYNSMVYDYQPQGRYMFPIILPVLLLVAYLANKDKSSRHLPFILCTAMIFIYLLSISMFVRTYL